MGQAIIDVKHRGNVGTEAGVEVLETVGETGDDNQEVSNTQEDHQVVENISHSPASNMILCRCRYSMMLTHIMNLYTLHNQ